MFYVYTVQDKLHPIFFMLEITSAGAYRGAFLRFQETPFDSTIDTIDSVPGIGNRQKFL